MARTRAPLRTTPRPPVRVNAVSWLGLREGEPAEAAGLLLHAGAHGLTIGLPGGSKLSILANDARPLQPLVDGPIVIDVFKVEDRMHSSSAEIHRCLRHQRRAYDLLGIIEEGGAPV